MVQSPTSTLNQSSARKDGEPLPQKPLSTAQIMALLASAQFDTVCGVEEVATDDEMQTLLGRCEMLNDGIARSTNPETLESLVKIIDTRLARHLPAAQLRKLINTIVAKDPGLMGHMPWVNHMLRSVFRAISLSAMLDPETIRRISADVANSGNWSAEGEDQFLAGTQNG